MKSKKGFVLLETAIVLLVVVVAMLGLYSTYSFVFKNLKQSSKYENINDLYRLNIFYNLMLNYQTPSGLTNGFVKITNSNCNIYFNNVNCNDLMDNSDVAYFIYTEDNLDDILYNNPTAKGLSNTDINYLKTLETAFNYLIGVRYDSETNSYYYASMKIVELSENQHTNEICTSPLIRVGTDETTGLPVVRKCNEEFFDLTNAIDYVTLTSSNDVYNYDENKSILLARYNLYVGRICGGYDSDNRRCSSLTIIYKTSPGYGLQSVYTKREENENNMRIGVVPFCGSSNGYGYWKNNSISHGVSIRNMNNIYDANYVTPPMWNASFNWDNEDYSIAYFVEEYVERLGINGVGRLLTSPEAKALGRSKIKNDSYYWLGSYYNDYTLAVVYSNGDVVNYYDPPYYSSVGMGSFYDDYIFGVRPVIVVNTSDIQDS